MPYFARMQTSRLDEMHLCTTRSENSRHETPVRAVHSLSMHTSVPVLTVHQRDADVRYTWCCRYSPDHVFSYWPEGD